jgi:hypothetical protein
VTNNENEIRKQFDQWCVKTGRVLGYMGWREDFEIWQASRQALEIELPSCLCYDLPGEAYQVLEDCKEAIESQGVKCK